jgi:hypothetical protein
VNKHFPFSEKSILTFQNFKRKSSENFIAKLIIRNFIFLLPETDGFRSILAIFRKNIQNLPGKLSDKTEKHNIGIH